MTSRHARRSVRGVTIEQLYHKACRTPSDINEHLWVLRGLASTANGKECVELGTRAGLSTIAILAGLNQCVAGGSLLSVDIDPGSARPFFFEGIPPNETVDTHVQWTFLHGDSVAWSLNRGKPVHLLFVDSLHTAQQVAGELSLLHNQCYPEHIAFHDTALFGLVGERGEQGILPAIVCNPVIIDKYHITYSTASNNGILVVSLK